MMVLDFFQFTRIQALGTYCFKTISLILNERSIVEKRLSIFVFGITILQELHLLLEGLMQQLK